MIVSTIISELQPKDCRFHLALHVHTRLSSSGGDEVGDEANRSAPYDPALQDLVERAYLLVRQTQRRLRICEEASKQELISREAWINALRQRHQRPKPAGNT
jgi:hypothetical protein